MADVPHDERTPVERAIDSAEARRRAQTVLRMPVLNQAHTWPPDADVTLTAPPSEDAPTLMIWDPQEGAWRAIILPPNSEWRIAPSYRPRLVVPQ